MEIPDFLYKMLYQYYDEITVNKIIEGYNEKIFTTIRVNTIKTNKEDIKNILKENNFILKEVDWYQDALIIINKNEDDIKKLDIYQNGEIYLQSLSSMMPVLFLNPNKNESILDMTAAPGGKTTQIAAISNNESLITATEKNKIRADRLEYNVKKQGCKKVTILREDARYLDDFFSFDKILLDAPCSGSGTIRLPNDNLEQNFNKDLINRSIKFQIELLNKAIKLLKKDHEMIYSTCSILKEENEYILKNIMKNHNIEIIPIDSSILKDVPLLPVEIEGTICVCPSEFYEGFFVAKLRKI